MTKVLYCFNISKTAVGFRGEPQRTLFSFDIAKVGVIWVRCFD